MSRYSVRGQQRGGPDVPFKQTASAREALTFATAGNSPFAKLVVRDNVAGRDLTLPELRALADQER